LNQAFAHKNHGFSVLFHFSGIWYFKTRCMNYKLRFVQHIRMDKVKEYLAIEKQFADLEQQHPDFPKGNRYMPVTGREPSNTLVWECNFETLEAAQNALAFLMNDTRHEALFETQSAFILDSFAEIYKPFDA